MKKSIWGVCALLLTACVAQRHSAVTSGAGKGKETIDSLAPNMLMKQQLMSLNYDLVKPEYT